MTPKPSTETATATILVDADGVVRNTLNGAPVGVEDLMEWERAYQQVTGKERVRVLLDIRAFTEVSQDARRYAASARHAVVVAAAAIVVGSPVSRLVGNFWLGINKPRFPARLFTDLPAASAWLADHDER